MYVSSLRVKRKIKYILQGGCVAAFHAVDQGFELRVIL